MPKKKKKYRSETLYFGWFFSFWKLLARNDDECISAVLKYVPLIAVPSIFLWIIHLQNKNLVIIIIASKANQKHEHRNNKCGLFRENIVRSYAHFSIDCNLFLTTVLGVQTERKKNRSLCLNGEQLPFEANENVCLYTSCFVCCCCFTPSTMGCVNANESTLINENDNSALLACKAANQCKRIN